MKLNQHDKKYMQYFKNNKELGNIFPHYISSLQVTFARRYFKVIQPKLTRSHRKLLHKYNINPKHVKTNNMTGYRRTIPINRNINITLPFKIGNKQFLLNTNNGFIIIMDPFLNSDFIFFGAEISTSAHRTHPDYNSTVIDYFTEDESLIFQYETMMDYYTVRTVFRIGTELLEYSRKNDKITSTNIYSVLQKYINK